MNSLEGKAFNNKAKDCITGEKCGTITISIYKEPTYQSPIFYIESDTEEVLPISYVIEDTLSLY